MFDFTSFYRQNFQRIKSYAATFSLQSVDCEDITQEIFKELWKKIDDGRADPEDENFLGYVNKLAKWRIIDKYRRHKLATKDFKQIGEENNLDELSITEELDREWKQEVVQKALKQVKPLVSKLYYKYFVEQVFEMKDAEQMFTEYGVKKSHSYLAKCRVGQKVVAAAKELIRNGV